MGTGVTGKTGTTWGTEVCWGHWDFWRHWKHRDHGGHWWALRTLGAPGIAVSTGNTGNAGAGCTVTAGLCGLLWELRVTGETELGTGCTGYYGGCREFVGALGVNWEAYGGYWDGDWVTHNVTGRLGLLEGLGYWRHWGLSGDLGLLGGLAVTGRAGMGTGCLETGP